MTEIHKIPKLPLDLNKATNVEKNCGYFEDC